MRHAGSVFALVAIVASGVAALFAALPSGDLATRVDEEIAQLERRLAKVDASVLPKEIAPLAASARDELSKVRKTRAPLLRLYRLRDVFVSAGALEFIASHVSAVDDLSSLRNLASERRALFEAPPPPSRGAALQVALQQAAHNRAGKLFRAAVPYAEASSPLSGLYYLGEAEANRQFATLVAALPFEPEPVAAPDLSAIDAAIDRVDAELLTTFSPDAFGRSAIGPSARLKEARELAARGSAAGAALVLLEARHLVSARRTERTPADVPAGSSRNDSITALWHAQKDAGANRDIVDRELVPLYASLFVPSTPPVPSPAAVTVTLVRWPYT